MATWRAEVFVNSQVGRITTEVQAATPSGAKEQIYAKHGNVQQIWNLRQVNNSSSSSDDSEASIGGTVALIGLFAVFWAIFTLTPWILMGIGGAAGTWLGQVFTGQTLEEYSDNEGDGGDGKALFTVLLALLMGGFGFVQGVNIQKGLSSDTQQIQQAK
jgi:hypothetical protein